MGRDGCRVPLPWELDAPAYGFNTTGQTWLPQPESFRRYARDSQRGVAGSTLELYKRLIHVRKQYDLGNGDLEWVSELSGPTWLAYRNGPILVFSNFQGDPIALPKGEILVTTQHDLTIEGVLEHDQTVWLIPE